MVFIFSSLGWIWVSEWKESGTYRFCLYLWFFFLAISKNDMMTKTKLELCIAFYVCVTILVISFYCFPLSLCYFLLLLFQWLLEHVLRLGWPQIFVLVTMIVIVALRLPVVWLTYFRISWFLSSYLLFRFILLFFASWQREHITAVHRRPSGVEVIVFSFVLLIFISFCSFFCMVKLDKIQFSSLTAVNNNFLHSSTYPMLYTK